MPATGHDVKTAAEWLEQIFDRIHAEPLAAMAHREQNAFDEAAAPFANSLVLFGAGPLGRIILAGLKRLGVNCHAFCDNNSKLWGTTIDFVPVLSPQDALHRFGDSAAFVVCVYNGTPVREDLRRKGFPRVIPFPLLLWKYPNQFDPLFGIDRPHVIRDNEDHARRCFDILADESSRRFFCEQLQWRYWLDYECLSTPTPASDTYFLVPLQDDEVFVDCGALDGDSIRQFLARSQNRFQRIIAVEPDPGSRAQLANQLSILPAEIRGRIDVIPYALGSENKTVGFTSTVSPTSKISAGDGTHRVECRRLDDIHWPVPPTYIKMDIEGAEPDAILGGKSLLASRMPVLAACLYHKCEHLWEIPLLIHSIAPEYHIHIRRYAEECWELVCYAVPPERSRRL